MLHYFIAVLDNTLPLTAALSLFFALALQTGGKSARRLCLYILLPGAAAALVYCVLKRTTGIAVREYYDLGAILPSLAGILILLLFSRRIFAQPKAARPPILCLVLLPGTWAAVALPNLLLQPFDFAAGMPSIYNLDFLSMVSGYCLGLLLLLIFGFSLHSAAKNTPPRLLFACCSLALALIAASQALALARILITRNMIPRFSWLMSFVLLDTQNVFPLALSGLILLLALILLARLRHEPVSGGNPAQTRKRKASRRNRRRILILVLICLLASCLGLTVLRGYANQEAEISPPTEVFPANGFVVLALEKISDGNLHRFVYKTKDNVGIRFIV
ncbi:MAG: hypothetical protein LBJ82_06560, partial [Deltaproteobacteria bacterium]|nr:hypothetical protein [Deltaproteobacteria bacterium]